MSWTVYEQTFPSPSIPNSPGMPNSRRLDIRRLKNSLKIKSNGEHNTLPTIPGSEIYGETNVEKPVNEIQRKRSSPATTTFNSMNLLPVDDLAGQHREEDAPLVHTNEPLPSPPRHARSENDVRQPQQQREPSASPTQSPSDYGQSFDLAPPPPKKDSDSLDGLSERLFCGEHLRVILGEPTLFLRFTAFLNRYKSHQAPLLVRYLETQKAIKAIEYANAIAETIPQLSFDHSGFILCSAALLDERFEAKSKRAFDSLVDDTLSAYITHTLIQVVTDTLVKEITGNSFPLMRDMVGGLAEVFCLSDPSIPDNPIIYASEEFYRTTGYGSSYVIGRNCRFLQGPRTHRPTIARLKAATEAGQEICETVLNYRRDGTPFMNLLMCAPLHDNRGAVKYYIGAQVDVSGLVNDGRGIESFERLLSKDRLDARYQDLQRNSSHTTTSSKKSPTQALTELGEMLSLEESNSIQPYSRNNSMRDDVTLGGSQAGSGFGRNRRDIGSRQGRRVIGDEDRYGDDERSAWALSSSYPSGKLPGLYQNYFLIRPSPSLRIIFVSPGLRIPGLLQSHFLSRIGGPAHIRDGISDAFASGIPVTAKVTWLPMGRHTEKENPADDLVSEKGGYSNGFPPRSNRSSGSGGGGGSGGTGSGKIRWLNCTPLLGSDDRVGVWMVVMVEDEKSSSVAMAGRPGAGSQSHHPLLSLSSLQQGESHRTIPNSPSMATPARDEWDGMRGPRSRPMVVKSESVSGGGGRRSFTDLNTTKIGNNGEKGERRRPSTSVSAADGGGDGDGNGEVKRSGILRGRLADETQRRLMSL